MPDNNMAWRMRGESVMGAQVFLVKIHSPYCFKSSIRFLWKVTLLFHSLG